MWYRLSYRARTRNLGGVVESETLKKRRKYRMEVTEFTAGIEKVNMS